MSANEALAGALEYVEAGYAVGPVTIRVDERGKKAPSFWTRWVEPGGTTREREQVLAWAREFPGCGWHAPATPNGFVVVEGDVKRDASGGFVADGRRSWRGAGGPPSPMTVTTQSGGEHWYFRAPEGEPIRNSANAIPGVPDVDVRGDGGTVFIAGTSVEGGGTYSANRVVPVAELPVLGEVWERRLREAGPNGAARSRPRSRTTRERRSGLVSVSTTHERAWVEAKVDDELRELARAGREDFRARLFGAAAIAYRAVGCGALDEDDVEARLREAIRRVWGAEPDADDEQWLAEAREIADREPWTLQSEPVVTTLSAVGPAPARSACLPNLPEEFWQARKALDHIRRAAHARCVSADVVLHAVLARLASRQDHRTRIETGLGEAVLNIFTCVAGHSGAGKSSAIAVARDLLPVGQEEDAPIDLADGYRDGVPIGSGEGLAELFMGSRSEQVGDTSKTRSVRSQVRHNALVYVDEGEGLFRSAERKGATISAVLRTAWTGGVLGQSNASAETTRVIPAGTYALGLVIGVQLDTAAPLFADAAGGTPQRFAFCSATDPSIPDDELDWPGRLEPHRPSMHDPRVMPLIDAEVRRTLRAEHLARHRGESVIEDPLDSHRPLHVAKVAALLAILDGRREVDGEDWRLAEQVWATSTEVRGALIERGRELEHEQAEKRTVAHVEREARAAVARDGAGAKVARIAARVVEYVADGEHNVSRARKRLAGRDRGFFEDAVELAVSDGRLCRTTAGLELVGEVVRDAG